jgi:tRNA pseudouridine38-40 synthase
MARVVLGLEYDGAGFHGWQTQPGGNTVQDHLEFALAQVHGAPVATIVAGRTDAGVHASAQVVHFDSVHARPESAWVRGSNSVLPPGIAVLWALETSPEFHARFGARERSYRYVLLNHPVRPAILAGRVGWVHGELDVEAMTDAAVALQGNHDFSAFRAAQCQAKSPVRELRHVHVARCGHYVVFTFRGNAFLHHQVRNMVGALVWVGLGRRPSAWVGEVLASRDRTKAAATFAPDGLYLVDVRYDAEWNLPGFDNRALPFL